MLAFFFIEKLANKILYSIFAIAKEEKDKGGEPE